jgi:tartrate-resistant acid phosphatase type 5
MTAAGRYFFGAKPSRRYYKVTVGTVDYFLLNLNTFPHDAIDPDGITYDSIQGQWLKGELYNSTNKFRVVIFHQPPYTDVDAYYPGYVTSRWPFKSWGANLIISGHSHVYERFNIDNLQYIVNGSAGSDVRGFRSGQNNSVFRAASEGYLKLTADNFKILGEFKDMTGTVLDAFSVNA